MTGYAKPTLKSFLYNVYGPHHEWIDVYGFSVSPSGYEILTHHGPLVSQFFVGVRLVRTLVAFLLSCLVLSIIVSGLCFFNTAHNSHVIDTLPSIHK